MADFLILGSGFTGARAAALLRGAGHNVVETHQTSPLRVLLPDLSAVLALPGHQWRVLWCAPSTEGVQALAGKASRIVYLSTTGVYGGRQIVDAATPANPSTPRAAERLRAEAPVQAGPWSACVLRPAAIYGPGRGVQESIRIGRWRIAGDGSAFTSRIHVDDLAAIAAKPVASNLEGAWPVADSEPCTNLAITQFCCGLLNVPLPPSADAGSLDETRRADRRVDGGEICRLLGVSLRYPSYREGVRQALGAAGGY